MMSNLEYFAISFYRPLLPSILSSTDPTEEDNFQDLLFLSTTLGKISELRRGVKILALWADGVPVAELNLNLPVGSIRKSMARNLRTAFKKIQ
jgi:hypothetical protein